MADSFTKLSSGILASTVWQEPSSTRIVWITMLALADKSGYVAASIPGLAHLARVSIAETETALAAFMAPDPYSRTPDNEGRRIEAVAGGWRLLNHGIYRARRDAEDRKEQQREWDRQNRPSGHARKSESPTPAADPTSSDAVRQSDDSPTQSDTVRPNRPNPTQADTDTEAKKEQEQEQEHPPTPRKRGEGVGLDRKLKAVPAQDRFAEFWQAYPRKVAKPAAEKAWRKVAGEADAILAGLRRQAGCEQWAKDGGQFIPHPATWLNGRRWEDAPAPAVGVASSYFKSADDEAAFDRQMREIMAVAL